MVQGVVNGEPCPSKHQRDGIPEKMKALQYERPFGYELYKILQPSDILALKNSLLSKSTCQ